VDNVTEILDANDLTRSLLRLEYSVYSLGIDPRDQGLIVADSACPLRLLAKDLNVITQHNDKTLQPPYQITMSPTGGAVLLRAAGTLYHVQWPMPGKKTP
jgi:hypothetical protein